ncbi:hypothetical protein EVAR_16380_1 [Eumeta japonica]|uniref:Uncharacterized protein n=1 Tax=Eumeta variegata TaxID=151549 RepID=A0A4C1VWI8_EUMVA|nr:hypothetical protein EVAR_16380_1 [Eumeta japonica]
MSNTSPSIELVPTELRLRHLLPDSKAISALGGIIILARNVLERHEHSPGGSSSTLATGSSIAYGHRAVLAQSLDQSDPDHDLVINANFGSIVRSNSNTAIPIGGLDANLAPSLAIDIPAPDSNPSCICDSDPTLDYDTVQLAILVLI